MLTFDHIGIVVHDCDKDGGEFATLVQAVETTQRFDDENLTVSVRFIRDRSGIVYEMIAPLGEDSIAAGPLRKKANLINQIAYRTDDLAVAAADLKRSGAFALGDPRPALAFGRAHVQFFFAPLGFVIELIEAPSFHHEFFDLA